MTWKYRIPIEADSETIKSDMLDGLDLSAGLGINLVQTPSLKLSLEFTPGMKLWGFTTHEGFTLC